MSSENSDLAVQIVDGKSILSYTLSLPLGAQRKIYIGGNVTDLPGDYCKYSEAVVCKLNNTFAQILIHPRNSGPMECTNTFNGTIWDGWRSGLSNADIKIFNLVTPVTNGSNIVTGTVPGLKVGKACLATVSTTTSNYILCAAATAENTIQVRFANNFSGSSNIRISVVFEP